MSTQQASSVAIPRTTVSLHSQRRARLIARSVFFLIACLGSVVMIVPLYWLVVTALKDSGSIFTVPPTLIPNPWLFSNFPDALNSTALPDTFTVFGVTLPAFFTYMWNTVVVTGLTV